jgi:hypothetical protein
LNYQKDSVEKLIALLETSETETARKQEVEARRMPRTETGELSEMCLISETGMQETRKFPQ